jgi:hypothetical protein
MLITCSRFVVFYALLPKTTLRQVAYLSKTFSSLKVSVISRHNVSSTEKINVPDMLLVFPITGHSEACAVMQDHLSLPSPPPPNVYWRSGAGF